LDAVLAGSPAEKVVDGFLRGHRALTAEQRTACVEACFGVAIWRRRLAYQLGVSDARRVPAQALLFSLLRDLGGVDDADALAWSGCTHAHPPLPPPSSLAERHSFPDWMAARFAAQLGSEAEAEAFAASLNVPGPIVLRANASRIPREALSARLAQEGVVTVPARHAPHALVVTGPRPNIYGLRSHQQGLFEVQDEGSQLLAELVEAKPGERVLDFCAGAGGKTLPLAERVGARGQVLAHDPDLGRLERLRIRAERAGLDGSIRLLRQAPSSDVEVDCVLVDAPCSELGVLRRSLDLRFRFDPEGIPALAALQRDILARAAAHVRVGGRLVYATCTLTCEENEEVTSDFERAHPHFSRTVPSASFFASFLEADGTFRSWPHRHDTDAFFARVYTRVP
jgi:16S rRNA (cytosine967-C5)-methyltransferase